MSDDEFHPELADYVPGTVRPVRTRGSRVLILVVIVALIVPSALGTLALQQHTAQNACAAVVAVLAPGATASSATFQWGGTQGAGWYCASVAFDGSETTLRYLGLIPGL